MIGRCTNPVEPVPAPIVQTIPSDDRGFREHVLRLVRRAHVSRPSVLQSQLALIFPKVVVRARELSGENPVWYVYRDGRWTPPDQGHWWEGSEPSPDRGPPRRIDLIGERRAR